MAYAAGLDPVGPADDAGNALASFPGGALSFPQRSCAPAMIAVAEPGAVITGEENEGVPVNLVLPEGGENLAHRPVDLHDDVSVEALLRFALELVGYKEGDVGHGVSDVEEEGLGPVA